MVTHQPSLVILKTTLYSNSLDNHMYLKLLIDQVVGRLQLVMPKYTNLCC